MEIFLAQLFGIYFVVVGAIVLVRRKSMMPTVNDLAHNRPLLFTIALIELVAGIALVLVYPTLSWTLEGLIALIGWMLLVEAIFYLALPSKYVQRFVRSFHTPGWYVGGGLLSVVMGLYLISVGFGLL